MDKLLKWFAMAVAAYFVGISIYNMVTFPAQDTLITNGVVAALAGWLLYYLSRKA